MTEDGAMEHPKTYLTQFEIDSFAYSRKRGWGELVDSFEDLIRKGLIAWDGVTTRADDFGIQKTVYALTEAGRST